MQWNRKLPFYYKNNNRHYNISDRSKLPYQTNKYKQLNGDYYDLSEAIEKQSHSKLSKINSLMKRRQEYYWNNKICKISNVNSVIYRKRRIMFEDIFLNNDSYEEVK